MNTRTHAPEGAPSSGTGDAPGDGPAALWRRWRDERDPADRDRLILHYAPLVKYVAGRLSVGVSPAIDLADLTAYGVFGLIDAIERFEPDRGTPFAGYAMRRIKGAIVDELRAVDWVPRAVREHARAVQVALSELEAQLSRTPSDDELAAHMGVTLDRLHDILGQVSLTSLIALDDVFVDAHGDSRMLAEMLHDARAIDPQRRVERRELRAALADAITRLPERERAVVVLYYLEGMTLAQIGDVLRVSESRVSQLHTKAVLGLRVKLLPVVR